MGPHYCAPDAQDCPRTGRGRAPASASDPAGRGGAQSASCVVTRPTARSCRHLRIGLSCLLRHLLPEHSRVLAGEGGGQGGGGGRDQAERPARQSPQGQGNGPAGERSHQLYRSPDPGRRCPCGCPRSMDQLSHRPRGPIRDAAGWVPTIMGPDAAAVHDRWRGARPGNRIRTSETFTRIPGDPIDVSRRAVRPVSPCCSPGLD